MVTCTCTVCMYICRSCYPVLHPAAVSLTSELDHTHPPGILSPLLDFVLSRWSESILDLYSCTIVQSLSTSSFHHARSTLSLSHTHTGTQRVRCWGSRPQKSSSMEGSGRRSTPPPLPPPPPPLSPSHTRSPSPFSWTPASPGSLPSPTASGQLEGCGLREWRPHPLTPGPTSSNTSIMRCPVHDGIHYYILNYNQLIRM